MFLTKLKQVIEFKWLASGLCLAIASYAFLFASADKPALGESAYAVEGDKIVHGPIIHENLALFVITGKDSLPNDANYVTLDEAMKNEWVVVHETGNVNELAVENITADRTVVILAGAVVKGGKQDRVLSLDMVLKPKSGRVPIASFCVEQSRWSQRGGEQLDKFSANSAQVSGKSLRKAVKGGIGQSKVWEEVANEQAKISANIATDVKSRVSPSSFQLAIENEDLQRLASEYKSALGNAIEKYPDAIGYATVINGDFSTADIYASRGLLRKTWDQHISSAVTEAIAVKDKAKKNQNVDLAWRDQIFKSSSFKTVRKTKTGGENDYAAGENDAFFRYESSLPTSADKSIALRSSFEKRSDGESLEKASYGERMQQQSIDQSVNLPAIDPFE